MLLLALALFLAAKWLALNFLCHSLGRLSQPLFLESGASNGAEPLRFPIPPKDEERNEPLRSGLFCLCSLHCCLSHKMALLCTKGSPLLLLLLLLWLWFICFQRLSKEAAVVVVDALQEQVHHWEDIGVWQQDIEYALTCKEPTTTRLVKTCFEGWARFFELSTCSHLICSDFSLDVWQRPEITLLHFLKV